MSKELEDAQAALAENITELKSMVASQPWRRYSALMEEQIQGRINAIILMPLASIDGTLAQEYMKGEIAAIKLCLHIVPDLIENMEQDFAAGEAELGAQK
jgi:hypothetical protein